MAPLITHFDTAKSNVEPSTEDKETAPSLHAQVRDTLGEVPLLKEYGISSVLIGSYRRQVSIRRVKDVDVFCRLEKLPEVAPNLTSDELLEQFGAALEEAFGEDHLEPQDRSWKVTFDDCDMVVDVVPARPCGDHWEIPDGNGDWMETNPEELKTLTGTMNDDHNGHYVPIVKLVRQTRRAHIGDGEQPGGLYFEILTYHAFTSGNVDGDNTAEYFQSALAQIVVELDNAVVNGLADPTLEGKIIHTRAQLDELVAARTTLARLADEARGALAEEDPCRSAAAWRQILGENCDGWVFPTPDGCNEDGSSKAAAAIIRPGLDRMPGGDRKFA